RCTASPRRRAWWTTCVRGRRHPAPWLRGRARRRRWCCCLTRSLERLQVGHDGVHLIGRKVKRGHAGAGLDDRRIENPARDVLRRVVEHSGRNGAATGHVCEVRRRLAPGGRAGNVVAERAAAVHEQRLAAEREEIGRGSGRARRARVPRVERHARLGNHEERHLRVRQPAELGALSAIDARRIGAKPERARVPRNEIAFAVQVRRPEAVDDIVRRKPYLNRYADRYVDLVRGGHDPGWIGARVADFPPPPMPRHLDHQALVGVLGERMTNGETVHQDRGEDDRRREHRGDDHALDAARRSGRIVDDLVGPRSAVRRQPRTDCHRNDAEPDDEAGTEQPPPESRDGHRLGRGGIEDGVHALSGALEVSRERESLPYPTATVTVCKAETVPTVRWQRWVGHIGIAALEKRRPRQAPCARPATRFTHCSGVTRSRDVDHWQEGRMNTLQGMKVAILVENGFEQVELEKPREALDQHGAETQIVSPRTGKVRGWKSKEWGDELRVDVPLDDARPDDYDALLLPGGVMNPDALRWQPKAVAFVKSFFDAGKPV